MKMSNSKDTRVADTVLEKEYILCHPMCVGSKLIEQ